MDAAKRPNDHRPIIFNNRCIMLPCMKADVIIV